MKIAALSRYITHDILDLSFACETILTDTNTIVSVLTANSQILDIQVPVTPYTPYPFPQEVIAALENNWQIQARLRPFDQDLLNRHALDAAKMGKTWKLRLSIKYGANPGYVNISECSFTLAHYICFSWAPAPVAYLAYPFKVTQWHKEKRFQRMVDMLHILTAKAGGLAITSACYSGWDHDRYGSYGHSHRQVVSIFLHNAIFPLALLTCASGRDITENEGQFYNGLKYCNEVDAPGSSKPFVLQRNLVRAMNDPTSIIPKEDLQKAYRYYCAKEMGAKPREEGIKPLALLWIVALLGKWDIYASLSQKCSLAEINSATEEGLTPLILAALLGREKVVAELLKLGANVFTRACVFNNEAKNALEVAMIQGQQEVVAVFHQHFSPSPFTAMVKAGNGEDLQLITALDDIELLRQVNQLVPEGKPAWHLAIGNSQLLAYIITKFGAELQDCEAVLRPIIQQHDPNLFKYFLNVLHKQRKELSLLNIESEPLATYLIKQKKELWLEILLTHPNFNIDVKTDKNETLLHLAIKQAIEDQTEASRKMVNIILTAYLSVKSLKELKEFVAVANKEGDTVIKLLEKDTDSAHKDSRLQLLQMLINCGIYIPEAQRKIFGLDYLNCLVENIGTTKQDAIRNHFVTQSLYDLISNQEIEIKDLKRAAVMQQMQINQLIELVKQQQQELAGLKANLTSTADASTPRRVRFY